MLARPALGALVLLLCSTASAAASLSSVPVVRCPTSYALAQRPPKLPRTTSVVAPAGATRGLAAYSNGVLLVLAPAGWRCHATLGAHASATIAVAPAGRREPGISERFAGTPGAAAALGCSLFAAAARELPPGAHCARRRPRRERVRAPSAREREFNDPPGVRGNGEPSGGPDRARGFALFRAPGGGFGGYAFLVTCTLPASAGARCAIVLADALTRVPARQ